MRKHNVDGSKVIRLKEHGCVCRKRQLNMYDVYVTDIALCAVFSDRKYANMPLGTEHESDLTRFIGSTMRMVITAAQQVGLYIPCFCLLFLEDEALLNEALKQAANQDWHRGEFGVLVYRNNEPWEDHRAECVEKVVENLRKGDFHSALRRISTQVFLSRLDDAMKTENLSPSRYELLGEVKTILADLDKNGIVDDVRAFGSRLSSWVKDSIEDIERQARAGNEGHTYDSESEVPTA